MLKKMKERLGGYLAKCHSLKDSARSVLLEEMGRKALREYFKKGYEEGMLGDVKMLSVIETYLYMCKVRREKGEA